MLTDEELESALPEFVGFKKSAKDLLKKYAYKDVIPKGRSLLTADTNVTLVIVKRGSIGAFLQNDNGQEVYLYTLSKGNWFTIQNNINYEGISRSEIICLDEKYYQSLISQNPNIELLIYKSEIENYNHAITRLDSIIFDPLDKRIATVLLWLDRKSITQTNTHSIKTTHEKIARFVGSSREVVSRRLKVYEEDKIIELKRSNITILNAKKLKEIVIHGRHE